jgi:transcriptional regulator with GAF, ATPase, and Fis domain
VLMTGGLLTQVERRLIDAVGAQLYVVDSQARILEVNAAVCAALQIEVSEVLGSSLTEYVQAIALGDSMSRFTLPLFQAAYAAAARREGFTARGVNRRRDGSDFATTVYLRRLQAERGDLLVGLELEQQAPGAEPRWPLESDAPREPIDQPEDLLSLCPGLADVRSQIEMVAPFDSTVLISGETGTGKEVVARALHRLSSRRRGPFVAFNCAAVSRELAESELFGHERGSFTGAHQRREGRFEVAAGGTLLLDEIGELSLEGQAKLLRVLQEREYERVGSSRPLKVDVRVVAATNRDLAAESLAGRFRSDLFFRLNVLPIHVRPLRERRADIPVLAAYFLHRLAARYRRQPLGLPDVVVRRILEHDWPGNVRELAHVLERAYVFGGGRELDFSGWAPAEGLSVLRAAPDPAAPAARILTLAEMERRHVRDALEAAGWRVSGRGGAAALLGVPPTTLEYRMKKLGIRRPVSA